MKSILNLSLLVLTLAIIGQGNESQAGVELAITNTPMYFDCQFDVANARGSEHFAVSITGIKPQFSSTYLTAFIFKYKNDKPALVDADVVGIQADQANSTLTINGNRFVRITLFDINRNERKNNYAAKAMLEIDGKKLTLETTCGANLHTLDSILKFF